MSIKACGQRASVTASGEGRVPLVVHASASVKIEVKTFDGHVYPGTVVGTDPTNDLAVIKVSAPIKFTPIVFADSSKLNVGDAAVAHDDAVEGDVVARRDRVGSCRTDDLADLRPVARDDQDALRRRSYKLHAIRIDTGRERGKRAAFEFAAVIALRSVSRPMP